MDVWTAEGWLSVSVLLDRYSRKVVGWAMSRHMDAALVQEAWQMAVGRRQPTTGSSTMLIGAVNRRVRCTNGS